MYQGFVPEGGDRPLTDITFVDPEVIAPAGKRIVFIPSVKKIQHHPGPYAYEAGEAIGVAPGYEEERRKDIEAAVPNHVWQEAMREQLAAVVAALAIAPEQGFAALEAVVAAARLKHGAPK